MQHINFVILLQYLRAFILDFNKLDFHKIEEKYCYQENYHKEQEFSIAEEECAFDPECLGFYHRECEGNKFRLCKSH